jgi:hypothetical protein
MMTYNDDMDPKSTNQPVETQENSEKQNRRELVSKLGRFAAYAAPFTVMAFTNKAQAASGSGPGPKHGK